MRTTRLIFAAILAVFFAIPDAAAQGVPLKNPKITGTLSATGPTGTVLNIDASGVVTINNALGDNIFTSDSNGQFLDANNGTLSIEIASRSLWDNAFFTALDWQARLLYSSAGVSRLDWSGTGLLVPNGNMHLAGAEGTSSAGKFLYVGDTGSAGITLEKTTATTGKYSFFARGSGDFGFYDELNARYTINIRKSDGVVEFPIGASTVGSFTANSANANGKALIGGLPSDPVNYGGLWFGSAASAPSATNYSFLGTSGATYINGESFIQFRVNNGNTFETTNGGLVMAAGMQIVADKTFTASGTTGARTINKQAGSVNFAAGAASLVVTNSLVTTSSMVFVSVATNDATMKSATAVAAAGSFTIRGNANPTAETRVNFIVLN